MLETLQKLRYAKTQHITSTTTRLVCLKRRDHMPEPSRKRMDAGDERQYMLAEDFEIYEKAGAPTGATSLHYHDFYELLYIADGEFDIYVDPSIYHLRKGDFLLIGRNRLHRYLYQPGKHDGCRRILLWATDSFLARLSQGKLCLSEPFANPNCAYHFPPHHEDQLNNFLLKTVLATAGDPAENAVRSLMDYSYLTLLFAELYHLCCQRDFGFSGQERSEHPLVQDVFRYVDEHLTGDLSLDALSAHVHMSKYHFLRSFKALANLTVHQFILHKRLIAACGQLQQGASPNEACMSCGFSDYTSFFRNFKRAYGISPREYRRIHTAPTM